ncbi:sodium:dicarboxylate symporter [Coriobacterium glomerans PW2]|uniref:Sodium:dicarboxylate symporter n=1 Tax=Coriobacterium glomerans (strain ATCC 49209 / DSM 20642 / JCM 10262 / PW2) TaxID=700015 RepID=F2NBC3_CORGP|nr:dicarboxylate/amino acid:cation symporter [Coriobacterium glomerans]AEB06659.1 sodium:dicarboxylate symporter [Coriobacterium glomerans PW2]
MLKAIFNKKRLAIYTTATLFLGIIYGTVAPSVATSSKVLGDIFMNLITMIVVPMILFSIVSGIASMKDTEKLAKVGGRVILIYIIAVFICCLIAAGITYAINPGIGLNFTPSESYDASSVGEVSMLGFFTGIVPSNIVSAMSNGNFMQVIFFSVMFGLALITIGKNGEHLVRIMEQGAQTTYKMLDIIMWYAPIGVFCLIGWTTAVYGGKLFGGLPLYILTDLTCCVVGFIVLLLIVRFYTGLRISKILSNLLPVFVNTVSTNSSAATIPITMTVVTDKFKVPNSLASFSISLGPTICKAGAGLYKVVLAIFVSQMYGIQLSVTQIAMVVCVSTFMSIATPGIPGGGVATGTVILGLVGLPVDIMGAIAGLYRLIDMGHTTLNVAGGVFGTLIAAKQEGIWSANMTQKESQTICTQQSG